MITITQAAKLRGVSRQAVHQWIQKWLETGDGLKAERVGAYWLIDPADLAEFIPAKRGRKAKDKE